MIIHKNNKIINVKLPKTFKKKWLKALRSNEYEQTNGELQQSQTNKYCCLGVACRIQHPKIKLTGKGTICNDEFKRLRDINVPKLLKGDCQENKVIDKLVKLNDTKEWSFKKIANWIDKNL